MTNDETNLAALVLSSGLLGSGIIGTTGKLVGGIMKGKKKVKAIWVGTLLYKDKEFEHFANKIALNNNINLTEL